MKHPAVDSVPSTAGHGVPDRPLLIEKLFGHVAAIFGELPKDGLVKPGDHLGRVIHLVGRAPQLNSSSLRAS